MRKMLSTTALAAVLVAPALFAAAPVSAATAGKTVTVVTVTTVGKANASGYLASNLTGRTVYASGAEDAAAVGDIEDVLVSEDGTVRAVIVGVGGFLGIGEKQVAVDFGRLTMRKTGDDGIRVISALTRAELEAAPAYVRADDGDASKGRATGMAAAAGAVAGAVTGAAKAPATDREAFLEGKTKLTVGALSAGKMIGARVYDKAWHDVGEIGDVVMTADGKPDAAVIDVGGFLGIGEKPVALGFEQIEVYQDGSGTLYVATPYSEKQLKAAHEYEAKAYKTDRDGMRLVPRHDG